MQLRTAQRYWPHAPRQHRTTEAVAERMARRGEYMAAGVIRLVHEGLTAVMKGLNLRLYNEMLSKGVTLSF